MGYFNVILFIANFFRTLLVIMVIYYVIKFIRKVVIPMFNPPQQQAGHSQQQNNRREGDVTVESNRKSKNRSSKDEGEYVDFEEVE